MANKIGKTKNVKRRQEIIKEMVNTFPEARLVKNKYKVIAKLAKKLHNIEIPEDKLAEICYDIIQADREWRIYTEDFDRVEKRRLEQEKILELGYGGNYNHE